jgi:hypothetical protein
MLGGAASAKTASYTLVAADAGTAISMSNASATTITVNTALFAAGDTVQITNIGAGVCTITAGTATVNTASSLALAQYESGTLDFTSTSAAIFIKGAAAGGGGKVLQVVSASTSTSATSTSTTYADTNLTCNITPTLATSKVLVLISQICVWSRNDASGGMGLKIMRGATTVYEPDNNAGTVASSNHEVLGNPKASEQKLVQTFNYLDSPATTSATTYKTQFRVYDSGAGGSATCQYSSTTSVITLLEIGA